MSRNLDPRPEEPVVETEEVVQHEAGVERHERSVRDAAGLEHRERSVRDTASERRLSLFKLSQLVWLCLGIVEALIGLRVLLKLIAANPANGFAHGIYRVTAVILAPFFGLTGTPSSGGSVLEVPSLIAMLVFALLAWGIVHAIWLLLDRPPTGGVSTYDRYRD